AREVRGDDLLQPLPRDAEDAELRRRPRRRDDPRPPRRRACAAREPCRGARRDPPPREPRRTREIGPESPHRALQHSYLGGSRKPRKPEARIRAGDLGMFVTPATSE